MTERLQNATDFTGSSELNALNFFVWSIITNKVNTAIPVRVDAIARPGEGGGAAYLSATPLVKMRAAVGTALPTVSIPKLRWFRYQHGSAAIICDPKPGDIGLAVFAQQDVSVLSGGNEPVQPGSFRCFDISDGFYLGGFWGSAPKTFIHIEDDGTLHIVAPKSEHVESPQITIDCENIVVNASSAATVNTETATINASGSTKVDSPKVTITGDTKIEKTLMVVGQITGTGGLAVSGGSGATVDGSMKTTGDVQAGGISLQGHVHGGVQGGSGTTGTPQ